MFTMVAIVWVGFPVARVGLAAIKFVPRAVEVFPTRKWVLRFAKHISSTTAWFFATIARVDPMVVAINLVVGSFSLYVERIALAATKVTLTVGKVVIVVV